MRRSDPRDQRRKGRSASGELEGHEGASNPDAFEEVGPGRAEGRPKTSLGEEPLDEFEPVPTDEPEVEWEDAEEPSVTGEQWEALLEELFTDLTDEEDLAVFEEVRETLGWSEGEVIWEGMDFDQVFSDPHEFHAFELLSRKDQRAYLRERLRTQQVSGTVEARDGEIELEAEPKAKPMKGRAKGRSRPPATPGPLVSYETETEHRPEELDLTMAPGRGKRRRGGR